MRTVKGERIDLASAPRIHLVQVWREAAASARQQVVKHGGRMTDAQHREWTFASIREMCPDVTDEELRLVLES